MSPLPSRVVQLALSGALLAGCAPAAEPGRAAPAPLTADVAFVHDMVAHHRQALEMTSLVAGRGAAPAVERLAERIRASQVTEIGQMERWLRDRAAPPPPPPSDHAGHARPMPGMLSAAEMRGLAVAQGGAFDRQFLELMIRHHEGAVAMVATLYQTEAAGQEPELFRIASDIDADQRAEIARMQRLLSTLEQDTP